MKKKYLILSLLIFFTHSILNAELKNPENQADYILVYHPEFYSTLQNFKEWRQSKGFNVSFVNIDSIYSEFQPEASKSESIREFLSYAYHFWKKPSPKYVLLVGGINHIPSNKFKSSINVFGEDSVSIDQWFVVDKLDTVNQWPIMALGRFPVRDTIELSNIIKKTIKFEDKFSVINYLYDITVFTDRKDPEGFVSLAESLLYLFKADYKIKRVYQDTLSLFFGDKDTLIKSMKEGSIFLTNFVHGNPDVWGWYKDITVRTLDTVTLSKKPFIFTALSCSQNFDNPTTQGIIEKVLVFDTNNAVATFASSGIAASYTAMEIIYIFNKQILESKKIRIGDAVLLTKCVLYSDSKIIIPDDLQRRYTLLGDPALMINLEKKLIVDEQTTPGKSFEINCYPNPATDYLDIKFTVPDQDEISINIFDIFGNKINNSFNGFLESGTYHRIYHLNDLISGVYFCTIKIGIYSETKKITIIK